MLTPKQAKALLQLKDLIVKQDKVDYEMYHLVYTIANPQFDKLDPWGDVEKIAKQEVEVTPLPYSLKGVISNREVHIDFKEFENVTYKEEEE